MFNEIGESWDRYETKPSDVGMEPDYESVEKLKDWIFGRKIFHIMDMIMAGERTPALKIGIGDFMLLLSIGMTGLILFSGFDGEFAQLATVMMLGVVLYSFTFILIPLGGVIFGFSEYVKSIKNVSVKKGMAIETAIIFVAIYGPFVGYPEIPNYALNVALLSFSAVVSAVAAEINSG